MKILIINGPNLNLLGTREPEIYGKLTLQEINNQILDFSNRISSDIQLEFFQSNHEGAIVDKIQSSNYDGIIINPAAYTHTSIAIADAIKAVKAKTIEVHLSQISTRETYRQKSYISSACIGTITGLGEDSYKLALCALYNRLSNTAK